MTIDEELQMIDELIALNQRRIDEINVGWDPFSVFKSTDYYEGKVDALEDLRDAIKKKAVE